MRRRRRSASCRRTFPVRGSCVVAAKQRPQTSDRRVCAFDCRRSPRPNTGCRLRRAGTDFRKDTNQCARNRSRCFGCRVRGSEPVFCVGAGGNYSRECPILHRGWSCRSRGHPALSAGRCARHGAPPSRTIKIHKRWRAIAAAHRLDCSAREARSPGRTCSYAKGRHPLPAPARRPRNETQH